MIVRVARGVSRGVQGGVVYRAEGVIVSGAARSAYTRTPRQNRCRYVSRTGWAGTLTAALNGI